MMNEVNTVLIEQCIYCMNDEPLQGEEYLNEAIMAYIDSSAPSYTLYGVLNESTKYSEVMSKYPALLREIDGIKEAEMEAKKPESDKSGVLKKIKNKITGAVEWYNKIDPETQAKTYRTITKASIWASGIILEIVGGIILRHRFPAFGGGTSLPAAVGKLGLAGAIGAADTGISKALHSVYYKVNLTDLDGRIRAYDQIIGKYNDFLRDNKDRLSAEDRKELEKIRDSHINALRDLIKIRSEKAQKNANKKLDKKDISTSDKNVAERVEDKIDSTLANKFNI